MSSLKKKTFSGFKWIAVEQSSVQIIRFLLGIILARLLSPEDYGIIGLITVFLAISLSFINSGFGSALIQKKNRTEVDYSTVFYFNIAVSIVFWIILSLSSKFIADFFHQPLLVKITPIIGFNLVINAFGLIQISRMSIKLDFKSQAKATLIATVLSGLIGIIMAYTGYGVWALVFQTLCRNFINTCLLWYFEKWKPLLIFSRDSFKTLFSFGSKMLFSGLIVQIYQNIYKLIIGRFFSASDLGFYTRAKLFKDLPSTNLTVIMQKITFPVLSSLQDDDDKLLSAFKKFLKMTVFIVMPLMGGMLILSEPLILFTIKEKWAPSIPFLQLLCFIGFLSPIHILNLTLLQVKGRSDLYLKLEIIKKILTTISIFITFSISIKAMIIGSIVASFIGLYINTYYTRKIINYGLIKQIRDFIPTILLTLIMITLVFLTNYFISGNFAKLLIGSLVGVISYLGLSYLLKFEELKEIIEFIPKKYHRIRK